MITAAFVIRRPRGQYMKSSDKKSQKRLSISLRLPMLFIASFLVIMISVVLLVYNRFEKRAIEEYTAMGKSATALMAQEFDADKVPLYLEKNFELEEYNDIREQLVFLKGNYPDIMYMYIYHFIPEGGEVIFDLDSDYSLDADPPGTIYDPDPAVIPYMDDLCAGKQIPVLTGDTEDGYMLTYMYPVLDSQGNYQCHVCVDFSMEEMHKEDLRFVLSLLLVLSAAMLLILIIDMHIIQKNITGPIDRMKHATDSFSYKNEDDHKNNITIMEKLDIRTGDEIENIYRLFMTFMKNNLSYMQDLSRAEDNIKNKEEQISQISQEAYRDSLTGVGSKTAYTQKTEQLNALISSGDDGIAAVMIDINNLKMINDEYGHEAGDAYIKGSCHMICETFKHSPVFRIGGDEFIAILQGQDFENRESLTEELRSAFAETFSSEDKDPWLRYSASIGMAERSSEDSSFETLFKRADKLMYEAKKEFKKKYGSYR